jgi:hypothetical protein
MRELTIKTLIAKGACKDQVELFKAAFGDSVDVTVTLCVEHAGQFNWSWAAHNLLSKAGRTDYERAVAVARSDYERARAEAFATLYIQEVMTDA